MKYRKQNTIYAYMPIAVILFGFFVFIHTAWASAITPEKVVELVNESRLSNGLNIVVQNEQLTAAAQQKANDMFTNDYFAHTSPDGKDPWYWIINQGYEYSYAGENLAIHFTQAERQHTAWMQSPLHRKNILNEKYQDIGVAVREDIFDGQKTVIAVQMFGRSLNALPSATLSQNTSKQVVPKTEILGQTNEAQQKSLNTFAILWENAMLWGAIALLVSYVLSIVFTVLLFPIARIKMLLRSA